jgi:hypothetical protein
LVFWRRIDGFLIDIEADFQTSGASYRQGIWAATRDDLVNVLRLSGTASHSNVTPDADDA